MKVIEGEQVKDVLKEMFGEDYGEDYAKTAADDLSLELYDYYLKAFADENYVDSLVQTIQREVDEKKKEAMVHGLIKLAELPTSSLETLGGDTIVIEVTSDVLPAIGTARVDDDSKLVLKNKKGEDTTWVVVKKDGKYYIARVVEPVSSSIYDERLNFDLKELS